TLNFQVDQMPGLGLRRHWICARRDESLLKICEPPCRSTIIGRDMRGYDLLMKLRPATKQSDGQRNPNAAAHIPNQVEERRSVPHLFFADHANGHRRKRDKVESHP